ncbi:MAG: biotin--[acetyl-CoA-carboxylase] ligase [Kiritimatiellaeota bacterium]|nr:biotin--[acetyl-CoA-carboxylase] ligase [Kiritimatiellota bacterium]
MGPERPGQTRGDGRRPPLPPQSVYILDRLRGAGGTAVSGEELSRQLGVSRNVVWRCVDALRERGYRIASAPHRGYQLEAAPDTPFPWEVGPLLRTRHFGRTYRFLDATDSTNRVVAEFAHRGAPEGLLVVADSQSAGRGRMSRKWFSPPGCNLHFSLLLRPRTPARRVPQAALITAVALARAVEELLPEVPVAVKWPNDLFVAGRKAAGVLCEMEAEPDVVRRLIIGVGINVNVPQGEFPSEFATSATSLRAAAGRAVSRTAVLASFLNHFEPAWEEWLEQGLAPFRAEWRRLSLLEGRRIAVESGREIIRGTAMGLSPEGGLLVRTPNTGIRLVMSGDAHVTDRPGPQWAAPDATVSGEPGKGERH